MVCDCSFKMDIQLPQDLRDHIIEHAKKKEPYPRKKQQFQDGEIKSFMHHKSTYITITTTEERMDYLKSKILVDLFAYWFSNKEVHENITDVDLSSRIKVCSSCL